MQREAVLLLHRKGENGIPLTELKRAISTDRSNARRAIRGLIARGLLEEITDEGVRRVKLAGGAHLALWLAAYPDDHLTLDAVPSRPLHLDSFAGGDLGLGDDEDDGRPHGSVEPSWIKDAVSESPVNDNGPGGPDRGDPMSLRQPHVSLPPPPDRGVNDNAPSSPERGDPMQTEICHANAPPPPDRGVSDPPPYRPGLGLEIAARMAREVLERLGAEEG